MRHLLSGFLLVCAVSTHGFAASKQYVAPETVITFADSAQSPSATFTLSNRTAGTGQVSARYDRGTGSHAALYKWRCTIQLTGTNVVGEMIEWYIATSDGTNPDGEIGTTDAALTTDKRKNLFFIGATTVDQTTTNTNMTASGVVAIPDRYISLAMWNGTALPTKTDTAVHHCSLTPIPFESQ
jgi:hypothetical protein